MFCKHFAYALRSKSGIFFSWNGSMAVRFLREMSLPCKEEQMEALTSRLSRPEAFGPVSAWGSEVFTEIGTLAGTDGCNIPNDLLLPTFYCHSSRVRKDNSWWMGTISPKKKISLGFERRAEKVWKISILSYINDLTTMFVELVYAQWAWKTLFCQLWHENKWKASPLKQSACCHPKRWQ